MIRSRRIGKTELLVGIWAILGTGVLHAQSEEFELMGHSGGRCQAVEVAGNYAYVGEGIALTILDISQSQRPQPVGKIILPAQARDVSVSDGVACVASEREGIYTVDVSDPANPVLLGFFDTPGQPQRVHVRDGIAYVADGCIITDDQGGRLGSFVILDISDPTSPSLRTQVWPPGAVLNIALAGDRAYLRTQLDGIDIYDVADPGNPSYLGKYFYPNTTLGLAAENNMVYTLDFQRLMAVDASDPAHPFLAGSIDMQETYDLCVSGGTVYVTGWINSPPTIGYLKTFDVSNPSQIRMLASTLAECGDMKIAGRRLYLAGSKALQVLDLFDPEAPYLTTSYPLIAHPNALEVNNGVAYLANSQLGMATVCVADPTAPFLMDSYTFEQTHPGVTTGDVETSGSLAFLTTEKHGILAFDIRNARALSVSSSYTTIRRPTGMQLRDNLAYIAAFDAGVWIVDYGDPSSPTTLGVYANGDVFRKLDVLGDKAYCACFQAGLTIIDVSNPQAPTFHANAATNGSAVEVDVAGDLAFIACLNSGVDIFDVSDSLAPVLVGQINVPGVTGDVSVAGNIVFCGSEYGDGSRGGLFAYDVSDPTTPVLRGKYEIVDPQGIQMRVVDDTVYYAAFTTGLLIFRYRPFVSSANRLWTTYH